MVLNSEIIALFSLMDDPDRDIYAAVSDKLSGYGTAIIPHLEALWENSPDEDLQYRIEMLIHNLQFSSLKKRMADWSATDDPDLLKGAVLVASYQYPNLVEEPVINDLRKLKKMIWLELNDYLTPLEQLHILNSMLYHFHKLTGVDYSYENPNHFLINKVLESKTGNALSNGILFQILAEMLDLPICAVSVPDHYLLAFFREDIFSSRAGSFQKENILFFIDATTGQAYSYIDMINYLDRIGFSSDSFSFPVLTHKEIITRLLTELSQCFSRPVELYKKEELFQLVHLLNAADYPEKG